MNDLIEWLKVSQDENDTLHFNNFKCLNDNINQLNNIFQFMDNSNFSHEIQSLRSNFINSLAMKNNNVERLFEINNKIEYLIRKQIEVELNDENNNTNQHLMLIVSILWMFIVRVYYLGNYENLNNYCL